MESTTTVRRVHAASVVWTVVALACVSTTALVLWVGREYYSLDAAGRAWHLFHAMLRPSGSWGHGLGIVGSALMLANLLYLVRRRWAHLGWLGGLPSWLSFHVAAGVSGVALALAHTAFLRRNPVAVVATAASVAVLLTGGLGRWIYGLVPHRPDGLPADEADLVATIRERLATVAEDDRALVEEAARDLADTLPPPVRTPLQALAGLPGSPLTRLRISLAVRAFRRRMAADGDGARAWALAAVVGDVVRTRRRVRVQEGFKVLLGSWRGVHRISTFVLLLALTAHVVTVVWFGTRWAGR